MLSRYFRRRGRLPAILDIYLCLLFGALCLSLLMAYPTIMITVSALALLVTRKIHRERRINRRIDRDDDYYPPITTMVTAIEARARLTEAEHHVSELERLTVWRRAVACTVAGGLPGSRLDLDRDFTAYTDCEFGHYDFHGIGEVYTNLGVKRIVRDCAADGCTSTWTERV